MSKKRNKEELPWVDIQLSAQEIAILNDEVSDISKLYIALSQRRDFSTGITGIRTKISGQALREIMDLQPRAGRIAKTFSNGQIFSLLRRMQSCGLIVSKSNYVFELPLAPKYESAQMRCDRGVTPGVTVGVTGKKSSSPPINLEENSKKQDLENRGVTVGVTGNCKTSVTPPNLSEDLSECINNEKNIVNKTLVRNPGFERFWELYPNGHRKGKKKAFESWKKNGLEELAEIINADVPRRALEDVGWLDGYIPNPTTYLNQQRWTDDVRRNRARSGAVASSEDANLEKWRKALYD